MASSLLHLAGGSGCGLKAKVVDGINSKIEIQIIVVTAFQVSTNPDLNQLWSILTGTIEINPDDDYQ